MHPIVGANVNRTLALTGLERNVVFRDDAACVNLLRRVQSSISPSADLVRAFHSLVDGRIRSDLCRLECF